MKRGFKFCQLNYTISLWQQGSNLHLFFYREVSLICTSCIYYFMEHIGIEPMNPTCKAGALPIELMPRII